MRQAPPPGQRARRRGVALLAASLAGTSLGLGALSTPASQAVDGVQGAAVTTRVTAALDRRPNVLLFTADDMRADDLHFMPFARGEFRHRAVTFTDALSPFPLCCPARAQILTGQYNHNNGVLGNVWPRGGYWAFRRRDNTLATWLRRAGYLTGFVGKFLNDYGVAPETLRDPQGRLDGRRAGEIPPGWRDWYASTGNTYSYGRVTSRVDTPGSRPHVEFADRYRTDYNSDVTTRLIRQYHRQRRPFFIWASHLAPHAALRADRTFGPPVPAARDRGAYAGIPLPESRAYRVALNNPAPKLGPMRNLTPRNRTVLRTQHRRRAESLLALDRALRAAVRALRGTGEMRRTVIIFASDNGYMLGEHMYVGKDMPYEGALRVPMIVNAPGIRQRYAGVGRRQGRALNVSHTVTITDIAATIVGLTGSRAGRVLDGIDITRPRQNPDHRAGGDRAVLLESWPSVLRVAETRKFLGVRTNRWTWLAWFYRPSTAQSGGVELYDRTTTPSQTENLVGPSPDRQRLASLAARMNDCRGRGCVVDAGAP